VILDPVFAALNYGLAHALLALLVVPPTVLVVRRATHLSARMRASIALGALVFLTAAPVVPGFVRWYTTAPSVATPVPDVPIVSRDARTGSRYVVWNDRRHHGLVIPLSIDAAGLAFFVWAAGAMWLFARLGASVAASRRALAGAVRAPALEARYADVLPHGTPILLTRALGPAAVGIARPAIVLPAAVVEKLPEHALSAVLLHEGAHVARRDPVLLLAQRAVQALFWWNPLVRPLASAGDATREMACDARAAEHFSSVTAYATGLVDAVSILTMHGSAIDPDAVRAVGDGHDLDDRIHALVDGTPPRPEAGNAAALMLTLAFFALLLGLHLPWPGFGMWHPGIGGGASSAVAVGPR
jgi:beta-lactamase regulating signal transducer with metallopeptidase domain